MSKLKHRPPRTSSARGDPKQNQKGGLQQRNDVALRRRMRRAGVGGHPNLEATAKNGARDMILDRMGKMSLVDDREHVVTSSDAIRGKAGVLEHEDMVLRVRNDRSLILRYLHHGQTLKVDNGIRHCRIQRLIKKISQAPTEWGLMQIEPPTYVRVSRCKYAPTSCGMGNLGSVPVL